MYTDSNIGHVLTGNLNIIRDRKLRKLLHKGPSYREQNNTNLKNCLKAIKEYKNKWAKRERIDTRVLNEWEGTITSLVKDKIDRIKNKHKQSHRQYRKQVLRDKEHLKYLSELHEKYVLVPAANNVLVVCKKYCLEEIHED